MSPYLELIEFIVAYWLIGFFYYGLRLMFFPFAFNSLKTFLVQQFHLLRISDSVLSYRPFPKLLGYLSSFVIIFELMFVT